MTPAPTLAIAIPTFRREQVLLDTLRSVFATCPAAAEVLVVDQSPEHEPHVAAQLAAWVRDGCIRLATQPPGLPAARNRALRDCTSDIVVFLDDDVTVAPGLVEAYRAAFASADVAAVGGRVRAAHSMPFPSRRDWPLIRDYHYLDVGAQVPLEHVASVRGCNHAVRRVAAMAIGGYDETYGWLREETDFVLRLLWAGYRVTFEPAADVLHHEAPSGGTRSAEDSVADRMEGVMYFAWRHLWPHGEFWKDVTYRQAREWGPRLLVRHARQSRLRLLGGLIVAVWRGWRLARRRVDRCPADVEHRLWGSVRSVR
ncbi:MAG: glycosyltransferase family 2 protein [Gemmatimonadota bacterium]